MNSVHHDIRLTAQKIAKRLELIQPLEYRQRQALAAFRFKALQDASENPPLEADVSDWEVIAPNSYWGGSDLNFVMHGEFSVPQMWDSSLPAVLLLPLGETGDFSHPRRSSTLTARRTRRLTATTKSSRCPRSTAHPVAMLWCCTAGRVRFLWPASD